MAGSGFLLLPGSRSARRHVIITSPVAQPLLRFRAAISRKLFSRDMIAKTGLSRRWSSVTEPSRSTPPIAAQIETQSDRGDGRHYPLATMAPMRGNGGKPAADVVVAAPDEDAPFQGLRSHSRDHAFAR
jgi:hypothetical protein